MFKLLCTTRRLEREKLFYYTSKNFYTQSRGRDKRGKAIKKKATSGKKIVFSEKKYKKLFYNRARMESGNRVACVPMLHALHAASDGEEDSINHFYECDM
jgi:hypothetical protein